MVAGSILPVCIHRGQLFFLFGKENKNESSAKGWSDFGGGCEPGETPYQTALREGYEESSGFLYPKDLIKHGVYKITHNTYHIHIVKINYDPMLPTYFNRMHKFIHHHQPQLLDTVLFEKQELKWFSIDDIQRQRHLFRHFYQDITDLLIEHHKHITAFLRKNKTKKNIL
jgi:8-oxo-dGTP pyrophosphatase MutT (NUDIX family)